MLFLVCHVNKLFCLSDCLSVWLLLQFFNSVVLLLFFPAAFKVPTEICTEMYAAAILAYSSQSSPRRLKEIHFIDRLPDIIYAIQQKFRWVYNVTNLSYVIASGSEIMPCIKIDKPQF